MTASAPPFVGRSRERTFLRAALERARSGETTLVCLVGEPGIGKTRLASELAGEAMAAGFGVRWGRAWSGPGTPALWPWLQILGEAAPTPSALQGTADEVRFDTLEAWGRAVVAATSEPVVAILDDLHTADVASVRLLAFVARLVRDRRLLIVATWRGADVEARPMLAEALHAVEREGSVLRVGPLDEDDVSAFLVATRGLAATKQTARARLLSGGNPFFLGEIAEHLDREGPLPDTVRRAVRDRFDRASQDTRRVLELAAVLGATLDAGLLSAMLGGRVVVAAALEEGARLGVLDGRSFRHDLVREVLYEALPVAQRARLHASAVEALAARPDARDRAAEIARHALKGEDAEAAIPWVHHAAQTAVARGTPDAVLELLEEAVAIAPAPLLFADLGEALLSSGDLPAGERACRAALDAARAAHDAEAFAYAALAWGLRVRSATVEPEHVALLEEAVTRIGESRPDLRVRLLARLAAALQPTEDPTRALELARSAVAEARALGDPRLRLQVVRTARAAYRPIEPLDERAALDTEALELAQMLGDRDAHLEAAHRLALCRLERGLSAEFRAWLERAQEEAAGRSRQQLVALLGRALEASLWGDGSEVDGWLDRASRIYARIPHRPAPADALALHRTFLARWRGPEAIEAALDGLGALPPRAAAFEGALRLAAGQPDRAEALWHASRDLAVEGLVGLVPAAELCAHFGTPDEARVWMARLLPMSGRLIVWGMFPACDGPYDRLLGMLAVRAGDVQRGTTYFHAAADLARRVGSEAMCRLVEASRRGLGSTARSGATPHLERQGSLWTVTYGARSFSLPDSDGLRYLDRLLASPGELIHVLELARDARRGSGDRLEQAAPGPALDHVAREAYRRRLHELAREREEAATDRGRLDALDREVAFLESELRAAIGLGGRDRPTGAATERARINLTQRIKKAIRKIAEHDPVLGHHLGACVHTGVHCRYEPPPAR
jgi:hypothetical protein